MKPDILHNRQSPDPERRPGIKERIKTYMDKVSVDIDPFGYEKKVTKNVITYLDKISRQEKVPLARLFARINKKGVNLRVFLHHNSKLLKEVPVGELVSIFTGGDGQVLGIHKKVIPKIDAYLQAFAKANNITLEKLNVLISADYNEVVIEAYNDQEHTKYIPLKELIKHFKK